MQKALEALPGVVQAKVDGSAKKATCYVEQEKFNVETAIAALADAGYKNSSVQK